MGPRKPKLPVGLPKPAVLAKALPPPVGFAELRRHSELIFIQDADGHSVHWHHTNGPAAKRILWSTFRDWATDGCWPKRRREYWQEIEQRLKEHMRDRVLKQRFQELDALSVAHSAVLEMITPLRDAKTGEVLRDPETGLPRFAVELPSYEKLTKCWIEMDTRLRLIAGEATERIEVRPAPGEVGDTRKLPAGSLSELMKLSNEDAAALARELLRRQNKESLQTEVIDAEGESTEDE